MDSWQESQTQNLLSAKTEDEFFRVLSGAAADLGFEKFAYGMRVPFPISNPKFVLLNNYPKGWRDHYMQNNYLAADPTVAHGLRSSMPLIWSEQLFSSARYIWEEARSHSLRVGWAQPCHSAKGVVGMLTLARSHDDLSAGELRENSLKMSWLAQLAHEGLSKLSISKLFPEAAMTLTPREIEVMRWTADGKTSGEISEIMNISESTVNFHVNNSVSKLGATNKTAAAIRALLLNLL
jgi:LuxR family transcriptional regulator